MIITIIAEPRSGSTNLANWFLNKKEFTILYEPITNPNMEWYQNGTSPKFWKYDTSNIIIKETYYPDIDFSELIQISDKVIILYRENEKEQIESWLNANKTKNWDKEWVFKEELIKELDYSFFIQIKNRIKKEYLDKNYFKISYEELYYNNGFQKVVDYINLDYIKNENFPYGKKYRINVTKTKTLI